MPTAKILTLLLCLSAPFYCSAADGFLHNGVTAHRGNSGEFPESTLPAIRSALEIGADWVEVDLFRTRDGQLVVLHDQTTGRVGDKDLVVADSTLAELQTVDVATDFRRRSGQSIEECPPQRILTLEQVLRLIMTQSQTRISLQPKMDCVAQAVALVKQLKAERWVSFNDGSLEFMTQVKQLAPEIPAIWDRGPATNIDDDIRIALERNFSSLILQHSGVTAEKSRKIRAAGLEAGAWTVNDRATMERLLDLGVERLYTDLPRLALAIKAGRRFQPVACDGHYPKHLQGVCTNDRDAVYWSFTDVLVQTDLAGKVLRKIPVADHHGDLCHHDGRLYVAVNLGQFNQPAGKADSWVFVYDAGTLQELARHKVPEVVHGAGGVAYRDGRFFVVGGLPPGTNENSVYEYDAHFQFQRRHVLASGYTLMGIQTAAFDGKHCWFGCYGSPRRLLKADASFQLVGQWDFDASLGIVGLPDGRLLVARGACSKDQGCTGRLEVAVPDDKTGLRINAAESATK